MQHEPLRFSRPSLLVSVSTSGSKGVQRTTSWSAAMRQDKFQYPQADRRGCNHPAPNRQTATCGFQYPQADRRGCNIFSPPPQLAEYAVSVSTSGSKGVQQHDIVVSRHETKQVSVSTSGSKGVQQSESEKKQFKFKVSVSTSGSKGVQPSKSKNQPDSFECFSIHKRIEGGATQFRP